MKTKPQIFEITDKAILALLLKKINEHRARSVEVSYQWGIIPQSGLYSRVLYGYTDKKGVQVIDEGNESGYFEKHRSQYWREKQRAALLESGWDFIIARKDITRANRPAVKITAWQAARTSSPTR